MEMANIRNQNAMKQLSPIEIATISCLFDRPYIEADCTSTLRCSINNGDADND